MSYGNSKKWVAPGVREKQRHDKLNQARSKICKDSPFWHINFDVETHKREFAVLQQARLGPSTSTSSSSAGGSPHIVPQQGNLPSTPPQQSQTGLYETPPTTPPGSTCTAFTAFSGKFGSDTTETNTTFNTNLSPVLCLPTVFTPNYILDKDFIAPWPSRSEMKYEGDDRIATDKLHSRFLGAPRVEGNETVNWQHRNVIKQYPLENYNHIPTALEVLERSHHIPGLEADSESVEEAWHLLSRELYELLDPVGRL